MVHWMRVCTSIFLIAGFVSACAPATPASSPSVTATAPVSDQVSEAASEAQLDQVKAYVEDQAAALHTSITRLQSASQRYYDLAKAANFDYPGLWNTKQADVLNVLSEARSVYLAANPQYEQMEGVVAGIPSLSQYDVILDAGTPGQAGGEDVVPFDLILPDGRVLSKPGNLFEVTEATLWGTDPQYIIAGIHPDLNNNGQVDLGDSLPDANVLKGTADAFEKYAAELKVAAQAWQPTETEAFGALLANVPTFSDFMESWKNSRFVMGDASNERGFVATSRLSDLSDNILSWQKIYAGLSPAVKATAPEQDAQINRDLASLQKYVSDLYAQEATEGRRFTPEEADLFNAEGQNRATAIAGQIAQVAAQMGIEVEAD